LVEWIKKYEQDNKKNGKLDYNNERAPTTSQNEHKHQNDDETREGRHSRTRYTRATHSAVTDNEPSPECAVNLTIDHILSYCKETETKRLEMDITKEIWKGRRKEMEKLITYEKEIELFGI
jgi:hypothetical protein